MRIWKYEAKRHSDRLAHRLKKYDGGQILLVTSAVTYRGQISNYQLIGTTIDFKLTWLARKRIISNSFWSPKWSWELVQYRWPATDSSFVLLRNTAINLEMTNSGHEGHDRPENQAIADIDVAKFHQNKTHDGKIAGSKVTHPKCLFFVTTLNESGALFQPSDPRNLEILADGTVIDPLCPPDTP
jgi:hypothetical protein